MQKNKKAEFSDKYFENHFCKYYPCHKGIKKINCLFCFCPLYTKPDCGGSFTMLPSGRKNCSYCTFPQQKKNYNKIIKKLSHKP